MKTATGKLETYYIDRKTGTAHKVNVGLWKHHVCSLLQSFQTRIFISAILIRACYV